MKKKIMALALLALAAVPAATAQNDDLILDQSDFLWCSPDSVASTGVIKIVPGADEPIEVKVYLHRTEENAPYGADLKHNQFNLTFPEGIRPVCSDGQWVVSGDDVCVNNTPYIVYRSNFDDESRYPNYMLLGTNWDHPSITANPAWVCSFYVKADDSLEPGATASLMWDDLLYSTSTGEYIRNLVGGVLAVFEVSDGFDITGDVNGDGVVDVSDLNLIINEILAGTSNNDLNGDGTVDVADLNIIINIILGIGGTETTPTTTTYTVNGVSFTMVDVAGGTFTMGATAEQASDAVDKEKPAHEVTLSDFAIGQTEVTQELWVAVMGSNPSYFNGYGNSGYGSYHSLYDYGTNLQRPVEYVSWDDCQTFIAKLNELTGLTFRLPTEAEWEYAARGGQLSKGHKYAGSDDIGEVAWYWDNIPSHASGAANFGTQSVATKASNELGLYDMSGNVDEWCADWYGDYSSAAVTNPTGPESGSNRVYRGGSWYSGATFCRLSYRYSSTASNRIHIIGLRLAR